MKRTQRIFGLALLGGAMALGGFAGNPALARQAEKPAPVVDRTYRLGIDDVIQISAPGHEDISQDRVILPDGLIYVNGLEEPIHAEGMTIPELKAEVFKGLDKLYNNLIINVTLKEANSRMVSIVGSRSPGRYALRREMRISTLMSVSGGAPGKLKYVVAHLIRNGVSTKLDLQRIIGQEPDIDANVLLQPGDEVIIDMKEEAPPPTYSVLGSVGKGGAFTMPLDGSQVTIARAIAEAGGKNEHAALSKVILQREGKDQILNLYPLLSEGKADSPEGRITMKDGDVLIIPEIKRKYFITGNANRPGTYYMPEEKEVRVVDAISEAGGAAPSGEQRKVTIVRTVNGKPVKLDVNLLNLYNKGQTTQNYLIQDQDIVFIPGRSQNGNPIDTFVNPLFTVTNLLNSRLFN